MPVPQGGGDALQKVAADAFTDYNQRRPHGSLAGLTPSEAYDGIAKESMRSHEKLKAAQRARTAKQSRIPLNANNDEQLSTIRKVGARNAKIKNEKAMKFQRHNP